MYVINSVEPVITPATDELDETWSWIGEDDRGVELEITAVVLADYLLVIHVMPTQYRRKS